MKKIVVLGLLLFCRQAFAVDLILNNSTVTLGGTQTFGIVQLTNNAKIIVAPYDGTNKSSTGNLIIHADSISIDATSTITARGAGYKAFLCGNGTGPTAFPASGGRGGCAVRDSGGGGAHFGIGGRGTKDCPSTGCVFPGAFEEDCGDTHNATDDACTDKTDCRNNDALPTVAGQPFVHSPWAVEFGAAGGDKGCRDNDGFGSVVPNLVGGNGGGRIVLAGVNGGKTGTVTIGGTINADGYRGCSQINDSGGGGGGGSVLIVGDSVTITASAKISAAGGLGGDAGTKDTTLFPECAGTQMGGTCDDCGGGGGGGIVNVMSRVKASIDPGASFSVAGAKGGTCGTGAATTCQGEAGGGAGELQLDGGYVGEICDGFDNDFDGVVDNGFTTGTCGVGSCQASLALCSASGSPPICVPTTSGGPSCLASRGTSRPRVSLIVDSSASMLQTLNGTSTFGDGSGDHPGIDLSGNNQPDDSKLYLAKNAVSQVISSYPEIDFLLARYHQDELINRSCQAAKWLECGGSCCTYDDPSKLDSSSPLACTLTLTKTDKTTTISQPIYQNTKSGVNRCINYAGTCGSPRRGADILVGFESDVRQYLSWLDGGEVGFNPDATPGNYCGGLTGDCELRAAGPTPIAESLRAIYDYVTPIAATDPAASCRGYSVILVSDGGEECGGDPAVAASELLGKQIKTYVIGVSVDATQGATLNAIAAAGGTTSFVAVNSQAELVPALTAIVSGSIHTELCNGIDDNCNGVIDEGYNLGAACDNGLQGVCKGSGVLVCDPSNNKGTICQISGTVGTPTAELCNRLDDNCNGLVDEGDPQGGGVCGSAVGACKTGILHCQGGVLTCVGATGPTPETCNGIDDDCDGTKDNGVPPGGPCGSSVGECKPGTFVCQGGAGYVCQGGTGPTTESCNGKDDDCNGTIDNDVPGTGVACTVGDDGKPLCKPGVMLCLNGKMTCHGGVTYHPPTCTCPPDECAVADAGGSGNNGCPGSSACIDCACRTPCAGGEFPCSGTLTCRDGFCVPPQCGGKLCADTEVCVNDLCVDKCSQMTCPGGLACKPGGICVQDNCYALGCPTGQVCANNACVADPCAGVTCAGDQFCRNGTCVGSCVGVACYSGYSCKDGQCGLDPCLNHCATGAKCTVVNGQAQCDADPCSSVTCGQGRNCENGTCVDDPCDAIHCPGDPTLVTCRDGQCVDVTPLAPLHQPVDRVVASGGGGLGCDVGGGSRGGPSQALALAFVLALLVARRRRSAR